MNGDGYYWFHEWATDPAKPGTGTWHLRWLGLTAHASRGRWQVTTLRPPMTLANWERPPGLVASGEVDAPAVGDAVLFDVEFSAFVPAPTARRRPRVAVAPPGRPTPTRSTQLLDVLAAVAAATPVDYYLRVVPLRTDGTPSGPPSSWVRVRYGAPGPGPDIRIPTAAEQARERAERGARARARLAVMVDRIEYQPERKSADDAEHRFVVTRDFLTWRRGDKLNLHPGGGGNVLDDVADAIGDGVDFLGDAVNWVSQAYEDVKTSVVDAAAGVIPGCRDNERCRGALAAGLEAGLAAMGVPPSLPDVDQLQALGRGYLIQTVADVASRESGVPIPPEAVEALVDEFDARLKQAADHGPSGGGWLRPDPDCQARPAVVIVTLQNRRPTPAPPGLVVDVAAPGLYAAESMPVPSIPPNGTLDVPVILYTRDLPFWMSTVRAKHLVPSQDTLMAEWGDYYRSGSALIGVSLRRGGSRASMDHLSYVLDGSPPFPSTCR